MPPVSYYNDRPLNKSLPRRPTLLKSSPDAVAFNVVRWGFASVLPFLLAFLGEIGILSLLVSRLGVYDHQAPLELLYFLVYYVVFSGSALLFIAVTESTTICAIYQQIYELSDGRNYMYFTCGRQCTTWPDTLASLGIGPLSHLQLRVRVPGGATGGANKDAGGAALPTPNQKFHGCPDSVIPPTTHPAMQPQELLNPPSTHPQNFPHPPTPFFRRSNLRQELPRRPGSVPSPVFVVLVVVFSIKPGQPWSGAMVMGSVSCIIIALRPGERGSPISAALPTPKRSRWNLQGEKKSRIVPTVGGGGRKGPQSLVPDLPNLRQSSRGLAQLSRTRKFVSLMEKCESSSSRQISGKARHLD
ncbi:hypothetical protein B0H10DRAFT_1961628 [Mycena sp. CBHHK59/15]|nr:hypothetical protein B0H10DRAFT_1961628 [Mycena sp. CBHHK59/15]